MRDLSFIETAGLPTTFEGHNIVFHSTRASFCTQLEEEDASEPVKSRLMGQGPGTVADGHYTSEVVSAKVALACTGASAPPNRSHEAGAVPASDPRSAP
jgi:hypothetical protein